MNNIRPKNPLLWIKYLILEWQWDRVLARGGHMSWEHYFRTNDPDYNASGRTVREQLCGYSYIALVPFKHLETTFDPMWGPVDHFNHIYDWCKQNCRSKFRHHWERVVQDHMGQYLPDGITGTDELFFGFTNEEDYVMFLLRWG